MVIEKAIKYDASKFILLHRGSKCTGKCVKALTAPTGNFRKLQVSEMHVEH